MTFCKDRFRWKQWSQLFHRVDERVFLARPRGTAKSAHLARWPIGETSFAWVFRHRQESVLLEGHERLWFPRGGFSAAARAILLQRHKLPFPNMLDLSPTGSLASPATFVGVRRTYIPKRPRFAAARSSSITRATVLSRSACAITYLFQELHSQSQWIHPRMLFFLHKRKFCYQTATQYRFRAVCYIFVEATYLSHRHEVHSQTSMITHRGCFHLLSFPKC